MDTSDVTKHVLVPKHTKLSQKDKQKVLEKYNISEAELPKISKKDPAISKLKVEAGDVIMIERPSTTAGKTVFYRVVVSG